jgi:hypothetical protein
MVAYDTTQIALFVSLVLSVALIGIVLVLGLLAKTLFSTRRPRPARDASPRRFHGHLAFHH